MLTHGDACYIKLSKNIVLNPKDGYTDGIAKSIIRL